MQGVGRGPPDTPASFPEPGCHRGPPVPGACPRRDKHGDPAYQRCRQSGTPLRTAIHGLAALMLTTCCLCGTAPVASMKPAGRPPRPGLRPSGRDPQWRPRPAVPVLDGPQCRCLAVLSSGFSSRDTPDARGAAALSAAAASCSSRGRPPSPLASPLSAPSSPAFALTRTPSPRAHTGTRAQRRHGLGGFR